jgi:single-stranded-DNA-specific exonuclease
MKADHLNDLRIRLNSDIAARYAENPDLFDSSLPIDLVIEEGDIDIGLAMELEKMAPFGCQNERPLFQVKGMRPSGVNFMGPDRQHVRFSVIGNSGKGVPCILFQKAQDYSEMLLGGGILDLAGYPDINVWNGDKKIQFVLKCITC